MGGASLFSRPKAKCVPQSLTHSFSPFLFNLLIGWGGAYGRAPKGPYQSSPLKGPLPVVEQLKFLIFHSGLGISSLVCCLLIMAHDLVGFGFGESDPA